MENINEERSVTKNEDDLSQYVGHVGGWLLLLCISLVIGPFFRLSKFYYDCEGIPLSDDIPGLKSFIILHAIFMVGLSIFSIYAGFSLWRIRPNAVKIAKIYLILFIAYPFIALFFPPIVGLPPVLQEVAYQSSAKDIVLPLIWGSLWFLYLKKSKRVKGTYGL